MLPSQMKSAFDGAVPSIIVTSSEDGAPNITNLSRIWLVDDEHVAITNQMLNKTASNLAANPHALIKTATPSDLMHWELVVDLVREDREGPLFETVRQHIETISWMAGISNSAPLRSVLVFRVSNVRKCVEESQHLVPVPETYGDLLKVLSTALGLNRSSYWMLQEGARPRLLASRGVPGAGTDEFALEAMGRFAALAATGDRPIRLNNISSQMRYASSSQSERGGPRKTSLTNHLLAFPIIVLGERVGVICCEETESSAEAFDRLDDLFLAKLSLRLGEALSAMPGAEPRQREDMLRQVVERAGLEWAKSTEPFHTLLSARERQVAMHVAMGLTNGEIAKQLYISVRTVTTHLERIFQKLNVTSRAALTRYVVEKGLLSEEADRLQS